MYRRVSHSTIFNINLASHATPAYFFCHFFFIFSFYVRLLLLQYWKFINQFTWLVSSNSQSQGATKTKDTPAPRVNVLSSQLHAFRQFFETVFYKQFCLKFTTRVRLSVFLSISKCFAFLIHKISQFSCHNFFSFIYFFSLFLFFINVYYLFY